MIATPILQPRRAAGANPTIQAPLLTLSAALALSLLAGCSVNPQHLPAPVEHRIPATDALPNTGSPAVVTAQPQYTPNTTPEAADTSPTPPTSDTRAPHDSTITALVTRANEQAAGGQYQAAAGSIERAIRITPDDAELWYDLARIRLRQGELDEAEELAVKSRSMAAGHPALQARNWRLVALIRQQRSDPDGAAQALETARELEHPG